MNDATLPGLIVPVEARIANLERGLARANRAQRRASQQMERRARQSADRMSASYARAGSAAAGAFKRVGVGALAGLASVQTVRQIGNVTRGVAQLGDEAERAGLAVEPFQEWKYVAEQNRIGLDAMVDGFKELNLRADEFITTGKGPAAEAFQRMGYGADELREKLKNPSDLMLELVDRMRRFDTAAQIRINDEIFGGTAGERFVELVDHGGAGLRATMDEARELGLVLDEDVVRRADELNRKFDQLAAKVSAFGKRLAVGIAEGAAEIAGLRQELTDLFENEAHARAVLGNEVFDNLDQNSGALEKHKAEVVDLRETYAELFREVNRLSGPDGIRVFEIDDQDVKFGVAGIVAEINDLTRQLENGQISADDFTSEMSDLADEADALLKELEDIDGAGFSNVIQGIGNLTSAIREAIGEASKLRSELPGGYVASGRGDGRNEADQRRREDNGNATPQAPTTSLRPRAAPPMIHDNVRTDTRDAGGGRSANEYREAAEAIREETRALELEAAALAAVALAGDDLAPAVEAARREAELLIEAQRQGLKITPQLRQEIKQTAAAYAQADQAVAQAEERIDDFEAAKDRLKGTAESAFTGLVTGAHSFHDALLMIINDLARMAASRLFQSIFFGGGSTGGGLLGGLFGFASGGYTGDGGKFEPAGIVHKGEFVMSKEATRRIGADNLAGLHRAALTGFSSGGLVGGPKTLRGDSAALPESPAGMNVTIHAPVHVEGSAGTPEQNDDLAKRMARQMESTMRGVVVSEIQKQMRPGNMLAQRGSRV
ncbi:hypothetical protein [Roseovarius indicus]|uniref:hypothetical protein n=1 Tax=Roseovarius indicus TaxID=540747 RepID=UPI0007D8F357|nr:hypothetical protein A8B76_08380 [Roseovarius indicus]